MNEDAVSVLQGLPEDAAKPVKKQNKNKKVFPLPLPGFSDIKGLGAAANRSLLLSVIKNISKSETIVINSIVFI